ncbi:uncharacterized protein LOC141910741 [Tubulanus polymorphus]|uniref:uncharacterized protein LOC141910741 n=1 Tax=Tubulanus polymorphus TaxID=672921 RepID=UPI003DA22E3F
MKTFAKDVGIVDWEEYNTEYCERSIYESAGANGIKLSDSKLQFYKEHVHGTRCPSNHTCVNVCDDRSDKKKSFLRGCMPDTVENCQEKRVFDGGRKTFFVECCDDFNYCNSTAICGMNLMMFVGVILGAWQFLVG